MRRGRNAQIDLDGHRLRKKGERLVGLFFLFSLSLSLYIERKWILRFLDRPRAKDALNQLSSLLVSLLFLRLLTCSRSLSSFLKGCLQADEYTRMN